LHAGKKGDPLLFPVIGFPKSAIACRLGNKQEKLDEDFAVLIKITYRRSWALSLHLQRSSL